MLFHFIQTNLKSSLSVNGVSQNARKRTISSSEYLYNQIPGVIDMTTSSSLYTNQIININDNQNYDDVKIEIVENIRQDEEIVDEKVVMISKEIQTDDIIMLINKNEIKKEVDIIKNEVDRINKNNVDYLKKINLCLYIIIGCFVFGIQYDISYYMYIFDGCLLLITFVNLWYFKR